MSILRCEHQSRSRLIRSFESPPLRQRKLDEAAFRGSRFADHPVPLKGNNELLNLTQPQVVLEIHEAYLAAGSDIVEILFATQG